MTNITREQDGEMWWVENSQLPYTFEHPEWVRNINAQTKKKFNQRGLYTEDDIIDILMFFDYETKPSAKQKINMWKRHKNKEDKLKTKIQ